jgi:hypothetical protein
MYNPNAWMTDLAREYVNNNIGHLIPERLANNMKEILFVRLSQLANSNENTDQVNDIKNIRSKRALRRSSIKHRKSNVDKDKIIRWTYVVLRAVYRNDVYLVCVILSECYTSV